MVPASHAHIDTRVQCTEMSTSKVVLTFSRDYNSDCGYCSCSCECLSSKTTNSSLKHIEIPRVKKYKTIKERNSTSKRPTPSNLNRQLSHSVEDTHRNVYPEIVELCESMQNLCMSPRVFQAYNRVSTHDQKILNRMAGKRSEKLMRAENAWLANKMWQNEKFERDLLKYKQEEAYRKSLQEKQEMDSRLVQFRLDEIMRQDRARLEELKKSIFIKDILSQQRLNKLRLQRETRLANRHNEEERRFQSIMRANDENRLNDKIRKENIHNYLENRLSRADATKRHYLDVYKRRLQADNYRELALHKNNYDETRRFENYKHEQLQEVIVKKDRKVTNFLEQKQQTYNDGLEKARLSSSLRELVRRSISPDSFQVNSGRLLHDRPLSNLSILSSFKIN